jgi:hypothetical protein
MDNKEAACDAFCRRLERAKIQALQNAVEEIRLKGDLREGAQARWARPLLLIR